MIGMNELQLILMQKRPWLIRKLCGRLFGGHQWSVLYCYGVPHHYWAKWKCRRCGGIMLYGGL